MSTISDDIREAYKGILCEEQIEKTIKWWSEKEKQAFEQGRQAGIKEAVEIVKGFLPDENERIRNWDLDQIGNNIEEIIEALLKEKVI